MFHNIKFFTLCKRLIIIYLNLIRACEEKKKRAALPHGRSALDLSLLSTKKNLYEESQKDTGGYCGTDDSGYVRAHGMHEQVVARGVFQADDLRDTR